MVVVVGGVWWLVGGVVVVGDAADGVVFCEQCGVCLFCGV